MITEKDLVCTNKTISLYEADLPDRRRLQLCKVEGLGVRGSYIFAKVVWCWVIVNFGTGEAAEKSNFKTRHLAFIDALEWVGQNPI